MRVSGNFSNNLNFKGARVNIVENSDNHGTLNNLPDFYNAIKQNGKDIFKKAEKESTLNLYINAGDFFINPSKTGWMSYPEKRNGEVQRDFLQLLIQKIKKVANTGCFELNEAAKKKGAEDEGGNLEANFDALYTPGNHCYDGGDKMLYGLLGSIKGLTTVITNVDFEKSPFLKKELSKENPHFTTKKIYEIPDNKDPERKHHLMVLGAVIPAMDFYNPGLIQGTEFYDNTNKKDSKMGAAEIRGTIAAIKKEVEDFKTQHPQGIVILSSHMGTKLSKLVRDEVPGITEILDAHKHDIVTSTKLRGEGSGTTISSLGMDNDIVKSISLIIGDDGEIEERESRTYASDQYRLEEEEGWKQNSLFRMLMRNYSKDHKPLLRILDPSPGLHSFDYKANVRSANSTLANFLTTSVKSAILKINGQEDVDIVGLQSSIIRGGLKDGSNNFDIFKVFDGVSEDLSDVKVGRITGGELVALIAENIRDNIADPGRNTIIHWSDLRINRSEFEKAFREKSSLSVEEAAQFIEIRKKDKKKEFEPLQLDKNYKIAIADKYLKKTDIETPALIRDRFESIGQTYHKLFKQYLESVEHEVKMKKIYREERIV